MTVVHDDIDASILEGAKDSDQYFIAELTLCMIKK